MNLTEARAAFAEQTSEVLALQQPSYRLAPALTTEALCGIN
jgi:hypothetical protein